MSGDLDRRNELSSHGVEVDWDRDLLLFLGETLPRKFFLSLLLVHPLEVNVRKVGLKSLSQFEAVLFG